jgi:RNA polymerase sigma factor (sigma-70 family)
VSKSYEQAELTLEEAVLKWQETRDERYYDYVLGTFASGISYTSSQWYVRGFDREDLEAECFQAVLSAMDHYKLNRRSKFKTFCWSCIHNWLRDLWERSKRSRDSYEEDYWDTEILSELVVDTADLTSDDELFAYEIQKIPLDPRQRVVITRLLQGFEKKDIAKELDVSASTISWVVKGLQENVTLKEFLGVS